MKRFQIILILLAGIAVAQNSFAQNKNARFVSAGIVNGKATRLPKPDYSQEAKNFCASGQVKVEVLIDESGNVMSAEVLSGDNLLQNSAVEAAKKAKFSPFPLNAKVKGILVYNFVPENKCINVGIINQRARFIPKPVIQPKHLRINREQIIAVQIIIDPVGNVTSARAIYGQPMLRAACLDSARRIKFTSPAIDGQVISVRGLIIYKFKPDGTIDTDIDGKDKNVIQTITHLVKPPPASCSCKFGSRPTVSVQVEADSQGNIIKATAVAGHPVLRLPSENAALASKILPDNFGSVILNYHFTETGSWSVKCTSVEIKKLNIMK